MTPESLREAELPALHRVGTPGFPPPPAVSAPEDAGHDDDRHHDARHEASPGPREAVRTHLENVLPALRSLESQADRLADWGVELAQRLLSGQKLLAAGNGGSAAEAQHLTAELVGRFDGERMPFPRSPCTRRVRPSRRLPMTTATKSSSPGRSAPTAGRGTSWCCCPPAARAPTCSVQQRLPPG